MTSRPSRLLLPILLALLAACGQRTGTGTDAGAEGADAAPHAGAAAADEHSFAQPAVARVSHVALDLVADFASRTLSGTAELTVQAPAGDAVLTLDSDGLAVQSVTDAAGAALDWKWGQGDPVRGTPLQVRLGAARTVRIHYRTAPGAAALQWLAPAQTAGGRHPFLFSQGQAILTRSWIPTQDSPGIRQTWTARIAAPRELTVLMSATMLGPEQDAGGTMRTWRFRMDEPVPPYLIALAIGDLAYRELGARTGVYAEPGGVDAAAAEFADLERMMAAAEALYGPYRWGRYDVLVLPPSFPFGGMENPRLTFATPTILAGDRSLVSLIAHELAHSWSGNLVTNATWNDFWLNEGFTVYFEGRIMEAVYGERFAAMLADLGWDALQGEIAELGGPTSPDTRLHLDLAGRDPDDGLTSIAYEKGAAFLRTIESMVGRTRWDAYLKGYFERYAFQSQTTAGFLADLRLHLIGDDTDLAARLMLDEWVHGPGLPANVVHRPAAAFEAVDAAAAAFAGEGVLPQAGAWSSAERVRFLNRLPRALGAARLDALVRLLSLDRQRNSEVHFAWLQLAIANRYVPAVPQLERFLESVGRRKFVLPLYTALMAQGEWGRPIAQRVYARARPGYHAVTAGSVDAVVPLPAAPGQ